MQCSKMNYKKGKLQEKAVEAESAASAKVMVALNHFDSSVL